MNSHFMRRYYTWHVAALLTVISMVTAASASAQTSPATTPPAPRASPTPQVSPTPSLERRFLKNLLHDQAAIWTSPLHLRGNDAQWLVPVGLGTAALIATDRYTAGYIGKGGSQLAISRNVSHIGATYTTLGAASAFYLIGRHYDDARARETGLLSAEALIDGIAVYGVLKGITQRPRPLNDPRGRFFTGGNAFPSGHATQAWALATVIANEYRHRRFVGLTMYGLAAAVSFSRYTGSRHFLSDVLVGSGIGYGIGRYVYHKRHDPTLTADTGGKTQHARSRLVPAIAPHYSRAASQYGISLVWGL